MLTGRVLAQKRFLIVLLATVLVVEASLASVSPVFCQVDQEEQVYYGFVPSRIYVNWTMRSFYGQGYRIEREGGAREGLDNASIRDKASLELVGNHDATTVKVYSLPRKELLAEFRLDRLQRKTVTLPTGSFVKVVSSRPVTVELIGGVDMETSRFNFNSFYTGTDGGYVGKEFIFLAVQGKGSVPYDVLALEDGDVTLWDGSGAKVMEFRLQANKFKQLSLTSYTVYDLVSTGNLMLQSFKTETGHPLQQYLPDSTYYPAVEGSFLGKTFYGSTDEVLTVMAPGRNFILTAEQPSKVSLTDLDTKQKIADLDVSEGRALNWRPKDIFPGMIATSERPMMFSYKDDDLDDGGLAYTGLRAGQTAIFAIPPGESYLFAYKDTKVTLDDLQINVAADTYLLLTEGSHKVSTDANVVIEVVNLAPEQGLRGFGDCLPSVQSLSITPDVRLRPVSEEAPLLYYAVGAVTAAVVIALIALRSRRRARATR